jgi:hypothetical protein
MNYQKLMAMAFSGIGALVIVNGAIILISEGQVEVGLAIMGTGSTLLGTILGFAIGEKNGIRIANAQQEAAPSISPGKEVA